jgi:hypothetical protein
MHLRLHAQSHETLRKCAEQAISIAHTLQITVEFTFNGIWCIVEPDSRLDWLEKNFEAAQKGDTGFRIARGNHQPLLRGM